MPTFQRKSSRGKTNDDFGRRGLTDNFRPPKEFAKITFSLRNSRSGYKEVVCLERPSDSGPSGVMKEPMMPGRDVKYSSGRTAKGRRRLGWHPRVVRRKKRGVVNKLKLRLQYYKRRSDFKKKLQKRKFCSPQFYSNS